MAGRREFEWDDAKARANLAKHGVPFGYAARVFLDPGKVEFEASHEGTPSSTEGGRADRGQAVRGRFHRPRRGLPHHFRPPGKHEGA